MTRLPKFTQPRLARFGLVVWLVLLTALLIAVSITQGRMAQQYRQDSPEGQIAELQDRLNRLEGFEHDVKAAPATVALSDFQHTRDQWQQQWDRLDQRLQSTASTRDLKGLQERVDNLTQQVTAFRPSVPPPAATTSQPRASERAPSFQALGIESRGGERFLVIQPNGTAGLDQIRLLRLGDTEGRWQLTALEARSAVFTVDRKTRRLALPEE